MLIVGLKNLLNEWYAVDTGYKVRLAKRQQREQGNFIGAKAPIWISDLLPEWQESIRT